MNHLSVGCGRRFGGVITLLALAVVAGCGGPSAAAPASVVPFASNEYTPPALYTSVPSADTDLPDCSLDALSVTHQTDRSTPVEEYGASGYSFELTNGGPDCAMEGSPTLTVVSSTDPTISLLPKSTGKGGGHRGQDY